MDRSLHGVARLKRIGGHMALDLANTVDNRLGPAPTDHLRDYATLVAWARTEGVLPASEARALLAEAARRPVLGRRALVRARALREAIFSVGAALARSLPPPPERVAVLHAARVEALAAARLVRAGRVWQLTWRTRERHCDRPWWPVAAAAGALLESEDIALLRLCGDDRCGWLFLDRSRNRSRRWCSPEDCGNRARVRQFRSRRRERLD